MERFRLVNSPNILPLPFGYAQRTTGALITQEMAGCDYNNTPVKLQMPDIYEIIGGETKGLKWN